MKKENTLNELVEMEIIEENVAYGTLKNDADNQRIYIDEKGEEVHRSVLGQRGSGIGR